jgi:hypothetical protein
MCKINEINDFAIKVMCENPDYRIHADGTIHTLITVTGKKSVKGFWRLLFNNYDRSGYVRVRYQSKYYPLHRIIAQKFIGEIAGLEVNHKDGNPGNNHVSNLELVTRSENQIHSYRVLGRKPVMGNAKINQEKANEIRLLLSQGIPAADLAKNYGVGTTTISYIKTNKIWRDKDNEMV